MQIKDIILQAEGTALICIDANKEYLLTSDILKTETFKKDYIFIGLNYQTIFDDIKKHLQNPRCKGFFVDDVLFNAPAFLDKYQRWLKIYSSKIELICFVQDLKCAALKLVQLNQRRYAPTVVALCGTSQKSEIAYILSKNLKNVNVSNPNSPTFQREFEPILSASEKTKYCICEISASVQGVSKGFSDNVEIDYAIFTKVSAENIDTYKNLYNYSKEVTNILSNEENSLDTKVITFESNDGVFETLPTVSSGNLFLCKKQEGLYELIAKVLGISVNRFKNTKLKVENCYEKIKLRSGNVAIVDTLRHDFDSAVLALKKFSKEFPDKEKTLVFSRITKLDSLEDRINKAIVKEIVKHNFKNVILIDLNKWARIIRRDNASIYVKKISIPDKGFCVNDLLDLKILLEGLIGKNCAILLKGSKEMGFEKIFKESYEFFN